MRRLAGMVVGCVAAIACARTTDAGPAAPHLDAAQIDDAASIPNVQLARWARVPRDDFKQELTLTVRDEVSKRGFSGRGVVAVRPRTAMRMILLGPGGTTAMDVWIAWPRWRVLIPALDKTFRDGSGEAPRGIPVPLLRRWLVEPFGGKPVAVHRGRVLPDGSIDERAQGFVAFLRRDDVEEVRARELDGAAMRARAWWVKQGHVVAWLEGAERPLGAESDSVVVETSAHYVSIDPPMTVDVAAETPTVGALPDATFDDPDAVH